MDVRGDWLWGCGIAGFPAGWVFGTRGKSHQGYNRSVLHGARRTPAAVPAAGASKNRDWQLAKPYFKEKL